jgi:hypothetical protein
MELTGRNLLDLPSLYDAGKIGNDQDCENLNVKNDVEEILREHILPVILVGNVTFWLLRIREASTMARTHIHSIPQMTIIGVHRLEVTMSTIPSFLLLPQHSYHLVKHCNQRKQLMELSLKLCWKWDSMIDRHRQIPHLSRGTNSVMARQNNLRMGLAMHHLHNPPREAKHHSSIIPFLRHRIESFQVTLND